MRAFSLAAALAAILAVPACGPDVSKQDSGTVVGAIAGGVIGNQFGKGGGRVASTLAGAVVGGIVGNEIGRSLDVRDRELARQAEFDAWERGPSGRPVRWRNPDNGRYGEVIPDAPYQRGGARLPRLHAQGLHRRPPAGHARHRLPQPRRHLDPGRLSARVPSGYVATRRSVIFSRPGPRPGLICFEGSARKPMHTRSLDGARIPRRYCSPGVTCRVQRDIPTSLVGLIAALSRRREYATRL